MNSIRSKFDELKTLVIGKIDILIISEASQFCINGYSKPYRVDRTVFGGCILIYVKEDIQSKILRAHSFPGDVESILLEINSHHKKWLICGGYNPHKNSINYFL